MACVPEEHVQHNATPWPNLLATVLLPLSTINQAFSLLLATRPSFSLGAVGKLNMRAQPIHLAYGRLAEAPRAQQ